jgi:hypothetical protein
VLPRNVRLPSAPPNRVDSFDAIGIETINLFLFGKMIVMQDFRYVGLFDFAVYPQKENCGTISMKDIGFRGLHTGIVVLMCERQSGHMI